MQQFRRFVRGPVGKVLLALIILPFVISGFYGYFSSTGSQGTVAEVAGTKITDSYVQARTQRLRQMIRQQSPGISQTMLDSFVNPRMVLEGIINEQLVATAAGNADMIFSDVQAAHLIRSNAAFQQNGAFSRQRFQQLVRAQGLTPRGYLNGLQQDHLSRQYRQGFRATGFALPGELATRLRLANQTRDLSYAVLDVETLRQQETITDEQIKAYYEAHGDAFMRPRLYRVGYLDLSLADYADQVEVSDKQIQAEYKVRKAIRENGSVRRGVSDILIAVTDQRSQQEAVARAKEARQAILDGKSFAAVAKEYSDDPSTAGSGGKLGMLGKGALPPKLEAALEELQVGEVSQPVVADSGVHLLRINREDQETMPPLKQVRGQIVADLKQAEAQSMFSQGINKLGTLVYEHTDLQEPAHQLGLDVQTTDWVSLQDLKGGLDNASVRQALQSHAVADRGRNSELLSVGKNHYVVVHLLDSKPPEPKPLAEVRDQIRKQLQLKKAVAQIDRIEEEARAAAGETSTDLAAVAKIMDRPVKEGEDVGRNGSDLPRKLVDAAFAAPQPENGKPGPVQFVTLNNGSLAAFQVTEVTDGSPDMNEQQHQRALGQLARLEGQQAYQHVMQYLHKTLDVTVYNKRLDES